MRAVTLPGKGEVRFPASGYALPADPYHPVVPEIGVFRRGRRTIFVSAGFERVFGFRGFWGFIAVLGGVVGVS